MEIRLPKLLLLAGLIVAVDSAHAATFVWTNTVGGSWQNATNWFPNQVPAFGDDVAITNSGNYTVTNNSSVTVGRLLLGGTNGIQILTGSALSMTNTAIVGLNGIFNWSGGDISGGSLTINGGGLLTISNRITLGFNNGNYAAVPKGGFLTNNGTVIEADLGNGIIGYGQSVICNQGLWQQVAPGSLVQTSGGTNFFINEGTLEQTGTPGRTTINWNFSSPGAIGQIPGGSYTLNWQGTNTLYGTITYFGTLAAPLTIASNSVFNWASGDVSGGSLTVEQGALLTISNRVTFGFNNGNYVAVPNGGSLTNRGTVIEADMGNAVIGYGQSVIYNAGLWQQVSPGSALLAGAATNLFINAGLLEQIGGSGTTSVNWNFSSSGVISQLAGGSFGFDWQGSSTINGNLTFSGAISAPLTIASNASFNWSGGDLNGGSLTVEPGALLTISNRVTFGFNNGNYVAQPNGGFLTNNGTVIEADSGSSLIGYGQSLIYNAGLWQQVSPGSTLLSSAGTNTFINAGTLDQIGGPGRTAVNWDFSSSGAINEIAGGSFNFNFNGPTTVNDDITVFGNINTPLSVNGELTFSGTVIAPITVVSNGVLNWSGGDLNGGSVTVQPGGLLTISNRVTFGFNNGNYVAQPNGGFVTNYGTVIQSDLGSGIFGYGQSKIYNAGLWQQASPNSQLAASAGTNIFENVGTLAQIGGVGRTDINWDFSTSGTINQLPGNSYDVKWQGPSTINGLITFSGIIAAPLIIASNAIFNWSGGDISDGSVTVDPGGLLTITNRVTFGFNNGNYVAQPSGGFLTNNGTVIEADHGSGVFGYGQSIINNTGLWYQSTPSSQLMAGNGTNTFINTGAFDQIGSAGSTTVGWDFENFGGNVSAALGSITFMGLYLDNADANLSISVSSLTPLSGSGSVSFSRPLSLTGAVTVRTENGFRPSPGDTLQVITYPSASSLMPSCLNLDLGGGLLVRPQFKPAGFFGKVFSYDTNAIQPQLLATVLSSGLFIQWPVSYSGWTLESTTNLETPAWSQVMVPCRSDIILAKTNSSSYFRLHKN